MLFEMNANHFSNCELGGPPPNLILTMPPPPLPSLLLPKATLIEAVLPTNHSQPCFANFMCDSYANPQDSGDEYIKLVGNGDKGGPYSSWLFVLGSSCLAILTLAVLTALILIKMKDFNISHLGSNLKQSAVMNTLGEPSKTVPFSNGGILYPCAANNNHRGIIPNHFTNDSRLLWATLTPHGTKHFISDLNTQQEGLYEVVDYRAKTQSHGFQNLTLREQPPPVKKSFDNNGFVDFDYEDPTPLMDSYHDDLDSGYQEPQEIPDIYQRTYLRNTHESSQLRMDNPNVATFKTTLSRRISDASYYNGANI